MSLKKDLINHLRIKAGQAAFEYILLFTVLIAGVLLVFGGFNPDLSGTQANRLNLGVTFRQAVTGFINHINSGW